MKLINWIGQKLWSVKFYLLFLVMAIVIVRMFVENYSFQAPVISKRSESYQEVFNDRAVLQQKVDEMTASRDAMNSDILDENIK